MIKQEQAGGLRVIRKHQEKKKITDESSDNHCADVGTALNSKLRYHNNRLIK